MNISTESFIYGLLLQYSNIKEVYLHFSSAKTCGFSGPHGAPHRKEKTEGVNKMEENKKYRFVGNVDKVSNVYGIFRDRTEMQTGKSYVFVGNVTKDSSLQRMFADPTEMQTGRVKFGPAVDPQTGKSNLQWSDMVGIYLKDTPAGISLAVKDREGKKITLDKVLERLG